MNEQPRTASFIRPGVCQDRSAGMKPTATLEADNFKRVILHLDLDCFYAQVEHLRLNIPLSIPLAVQQWSNLIAVNYASRDFGVSRHTSVTEALKKCPQLRLVHVPTYSIETSIVSEDAEEIVVAKARYHDELLMPSFRSDGTRIPPSPPDPGTSKACLEPYRHASMAIFRVLRQWSSEQSPGTLLEKGGLDEAFLDVTDEVEQQLIDEFAQKYQMVREELEELESPDGPGLGPELLENLQSYDLSWVETLDYSGLGEAAIASDDFNEDINESSKEIDDVQAEVQKVRRLLGKLRIWKGAQLARSLRSRLRSELNYIASIGIGSNKMLAKLVSALFKPDRQTRIEPDQIMAFMKRVPFEKIRMMGGKVGRSVLVGGSKRNGFDDEAEAEADSESFGFGDDIVASDGSDDEVNDNGHGTDHNMAVDAKSTKIMAADLQSLTLAELSERVGDKVTGQWIYNLIRGVDPSPVTPRSLIKSFMSAKLFRPYIKDWPALHDWCVVLIGELWSRIQEEREQSSRWPRTISLHFRKFTARRNQPPASNYASYGISKSCEFPFASSTPLQARPSDILNACFRLFRRAAAENNNNPDPAAQLFPMSRLAISVSGFTSLEADGRAKATRVDQYFSKCTGSASEDGSLFQLPPSKAALFQPKTIEQPPMAIKKTRALPQTSVLELLQRQQHHKLQPKTPATEAEVRPAIPIKSKGILKYFTTGNKHGGVSNASKFECPKCPFQCAKTAVKEIQEHSDYHFALELSRGQGIDLSS